MWRFVRAATRSRIEAAHRRCKVSAAGATCIDCHMPKRRTEDAVHVVMTDHYIQRQRPSRDLLAERTEADSLTHGDYRGEVALYYPPKLPSTPENDLYLAVAQVQQGSNLTAGIRQLQQAIERHRPARAEFYYELARAHAAAGDHDAASDGPRKRLARDGAFVPALKQLATAAIAKGELSRAAQTLEKVIALREADANALADLGNVYLQQGRNDVAYTTAQRALAARSEPSTGEQHDRACGASQRRAGGGRDIFSGSDPAATRFGRGAQQSRQPSGGAERVLGGGSSLREGDCHRSRIRRRAPQLWRRPGADASRITKPLWSCGTWFNLAPGLAQAHVDLADVLTALGRVDEAAREFTIAANGNDAEAREAAQAGLRALGR